MGYPSESNLADIEAPFSGAVYQSRRNRGYTHDEAIAYPEDVAYKATYYVDGTFYPNVMLLANAFGLPYGTVGRRLRNDFTASEAVAYPGDIKYRGRYYYKNVFFPSLSLLEAYTGVKQELIRQRLNFGMSLAHAIQRPSTWHPPRAVTVNGVPYKSRYAAARAYGVPPTQFSSRLDKHWTPEQAAGLVPTPRQVKYFVHDRYFDSLEQLARHYGKSTTSIRNQLQNNTPIEVAIRVAKKRTPGT